MLWLLAAAAAIQPAADASVPPARPAVLGRCEVIEQTAAGRIKLTEQFAPEGGVNKFAIEYLADIPAEQAGAPAVSLRGYLLGAGAPVADLLGTPMGKFSMFELRIKPAKPLTEAAILSFARPTDETSDLALGKWVAPDGANPVSAYASYDGWRSAVADGGGLAWALRDAAKGGTPLAAGVVPLAAIDQARTAMLDFVRRFEGKDLRTVPIEFKPGRTCTE